MTKSGKQRRVEIRAARMKKALDRQRTSCRNDNGFYHWEAETGEGKPPKGAVLADRQALAHNNTYGFMPRFYLDRAFCCADCGKHELWTAKQQKWWYELIKGHIDSRAKYCARCRRLRREERRKARNLHFAGVIEKYGLSDAAKRLDRTIEELVLWQQKKQ